MIYIGGHYRGPELKDSSIWKMLAIAMRAVKAGRSDFRKGSCPAVNVVFYVPGSLGDFDIPKIEASRFSRKQKLLLVAVPVPREVAQAGGSVEFVIGALRQAVAIAAEVFAGKNVGTFDSAKAEALIEKVRQALMARQD